MKSNGKLILFTLFLVTLTTACKYFFGDNLSWSGFTPVFAIALFSGMIIRQKDMSFILPLLSLFISDVVIQFLYSINEFDYPGFYSGQWKNYLLLLSLTLIGWALKGKSYGRMALGAVAAPTLYFLVSNFMVWQAVSEVAYPKTWDGLMACYTAAIPFYKNELLATLLFLPAIAFTYNYMMSNRAALKLA
ncbi:MAG: hypothetical protein JNM88_15755 [Chitinophagaceae bacterium]|nr:hypothetical protein [Chitinophagaceae bacterium]